MKPGPSTLRLCILILAALALGIPDRLDAAQTLTLKLSRIPDNTPLHDRIHAAGTFNQWNPADPNAVFQKDADGVLTLTLSVSGPVAFKITRGSWATVERDEDGRDIRNREVVLKGESGTKALHVGSWADSQGVPGSTRSGRVEVLDFSLKGWGTRRIWIYLPPDYARSDKKYSVLYMYDAQNLFDRRSTAFGQEWTVDESLEELYYEENHPGLIVVAVDNSNRRGCEYNVFPDDPHPYCADGSALGQSLNEAIVKELKPFVDQRFRTRPEREQTAIMGSSMGGQMALAMGLTYPETFSRVFALSPSYQNQLHNPLRMPQWIRSLNPAPLFSVYQDIGDAEVIRDIKPETLIANMKAVSEALRNQGFTSEQNEASVIPGAVHNEKAWSARFKDLARRLN
ncbi:MAG TPA: alpha/beta hydrolase-fold protein [Oligoflexus sp.]|uniref:alpha/beta hydrolase n=1 Tax=Oligoflexus sp. TaxID=1971216 RepID=UPI002D7F8BBD|nr:alpha/beta hydrolase-fold protein [Oligoflexus sp.]HET9236075.1 alpha/beta hydrolase-fold protein [Oligoflexus sp.]